MGISNKALSLLSRRRAAKQTLPKGQAFISATELIYSVAGYDWQACWDDYRMQVISNLLVPFWAWVFQGAHWGYHRWHQLEKAMLAIQDLHCEEYLA